MRRWQMRKDVSFVSKRLLCRGWLYVPDGLIKEQRAPAIVMAHGFTAVKEMSLAGFAERFADAGFVTLVFDYRYFGESEGEPRSQVFPLEMVEDYRNGVTWLSDQPRVDPQRIGVWGTSLSGGLVLSVGTFDKRVKAVVAQVPLAMNPESRRALDHEAWDRAGELLIQDRMERYRSGTVKYMKVVSPEGGSCALPGQEPYDEFMMLAKTAPSWRNEVSLESLEKMREFDPVSLIHMMAPTALLLIPGERDSLIPLEAVRATYERAREPKAISVLPVRHFEVYREPWLSKAADLAVDWFQKHL
jgi:fermentation-respiration switch protein FrsA (DUF1100 family)